MDFEQNKHTDIEPETPDNQEPMLNPTAPDAAGDNNISLSGGSYNNNNYNQSDGTVSSSQNNYNQNNYDADSSYNDYNYYNQNSGTANNSYNSYNQNSGTANSSYNNYNQNNSTANNNYNNYNQNNSTANNSYNNYNQNNSTANNSYNSYNPNNAVNNNYNNYGSNNNSGYNSYNQNNNQYPYYERNLYRKPYVEPGSNFATAAMVLGILSIITCFTFTVYPAFVFGSISIVLALISKGRRPKLTGKANIGIICAATGLILNTLIVTFSIILLFTNPDVRATVNKTFEQQYGTSFDEMWDEIMENNGF